MTNAQQYVINHIKKLLAPIVYDDPDKYSYKVLNEANVFDNEEYSCATTIYFSPPYDNIKSALVIASNHTISINTMVSIVKKIEMDIPSFDFYTVRFYNSEKILDSIFAHYTQWDKDNKFQYYEYNPTYCSLSTVNKKYVQSLAEWKIPFTDIVVYTSASAVDFSLCIVGENSSYEE